MPSSWFRVAAVVSLVLVASACSSDGTRTAASEVADARVSRVSRPGPPAATRVETTDATCVVSWQPPVRDGGAPITRYVVTSESQPGTGDPSVEIGTSETASQTSSTTMTFARTVGAPQDIRVVARNSAGDGPATDPVSC